MGTEKNEYGTPVASYICETCGQTFTVCPIPESDEQWANCLSRECKSYDPARDAGWLFGDNPKVRPMAYPVRSDLE